MRPEGNKEKDSHIKRDIFQREILNRYFVHFVVDDRLQVCRMWHDMGVPLLRVGNPDADF